MGCHDVNKLSILQNKHDRFLCSFYERKLDALRIRRPVWGKRDLHHIFEHLRSVDSYTDAHWPLASLGMEL